jgi:hypothetical protein
MCLSHSQQIICLSQGRQNVFEPRSTDHLFEPQSGQNKGNKIGICCFSTKQAALRSKEWEQRLIRLFRIISIPSKFCYFRLPDHVILLVCKALDFRCQCTQQKLQSICTVLTFDSQLKKILTFSVQDRYQLNYFICIKDFNAETITSLKLNLFSFFICCCQHHERKTICLYIFLISDR